MREPETERGQALVEFVLLFPLVLVMILFVVEFGFALHAHITVNGAAREAARHAAVAQLPSASAGAATRVCPSLGGSIHERTEDASIGIVDCSEVTVGYIEQNGVPDFQRGDSVVVRIDHTYNAKTPLGDLFALFSFGTLPDTFQIGACADARLEGMPSDQTVLAADAAGDCGS